MNRHPGSTPHGRLLAWHIGRAEGGWEGTVLSPSSLGRGSPEPWHGSLSLGTRGFYKHRAKFPWPPTSYMSPRFYSMQPQRPLQPPLYYFPIFSSLALATLASRAPWTHGASSNLMTCALPFSSARNPRSQLKCHLSQEPSDYLIPIMPIHPPSQHPPHIVLYSLSSTFHCLKLSCLFLSSPPQGEALSILLSASPETQKHAWHRVND